MEVDSSFLQKENIYLIDLRDAQDFKKKHIGSSINISFSELLINTDKYLLKDRKYLLICTYGIKSKKTSTILNKKGYHTYSLKGGIKSLH